MLYPMAVLARSAAIARRITVVGFTHVATLRPDTAACPVSEPCQACLLFEFDAIGHGLLAHRLGWPRALSTRAVFWLAERVCLPERHNTVDYIAAIRSGALHHDDLAGDRTLEVTR